MELSDIQRKILEEKYKLPGESDEKWLHRVVSAVSISEGNNSSIWYDKFWNKMEPLEFIPGGSVLMNAGIPVHIAQGNNIIIHPNGGMNNCSALYVEDSIESIAQTSYEYIVCAKHRLGVGIDLSRISHRGRPLKRTQGKETASGVVGMMKIIIGGSEEMSLGGCLDGNTLIYTEDGVHTLRYIVENKLDIRVLTHKGWKKITSHFYNEEHLMWRLITKRGHHIIATEYHKFYTEGDTMKSLRELSVGDTIRVVDSTLPYIETKSYVPLKPSSIYKMKEQIFPSFPKNPPLPVDFPTEIQEDLGYWLGVTTFRGYLGKNTGTVPNKYPYECINIMMRIDKDKEVMEKFRSISKSLFFTEGNLVDASGYLIVNIEYPLMASWLVENNLQSLMSRNGNYSSDILTHCPLSVQRSYIAGIFDAIGEYDGVYSIRASDCRVLETIQNILLRYGIKSTITDDKSFKYSTGWIFALSIEDNENFASFMYPYSVRVKGETEFNGWDSVPIEDLWGDIRLREDEIISIEYAGMLPSYDLEVEDTHKYIANGIYVSNSRRSAGLMALKWDHPDIIHFINCKRGDVTMNLYNPLTQQMETCHNRPFHNANLSVLLDTYFWELLKKGNDKVNKIWDEIVLRAWECGDPGIMFIDNMNANNPLKPLWGDITIGNACSELPIYSTKELSESCCLGSIILPNHLVRCGSTYRIDFDKLRETISIGIRFLDNVLDVSYYPLDKIRLGSQLLRRVGLGVTGFADILMLMGLSYGSPECISFIHTLFSFIRYVADETTYNLGIEKGNFPMLEEINKVSKFADYRRNIATLALAPTGSVTTLGGCLGYSIEPIFAHSFKKLMPNIKGVGAKHFVNPYLPPLMEEEYDIVLEQGTLENITSIDAETKEVFLTTREIPIERRLSVLSVIQQYVDNGASTTVNLPATATIEDVKKVFELAHTMGIKAITIYRDTSLTQQAVEYGIKDKKEESQENDCKG